MFWQNIFHKNEESETAYIKGFEVACTQKGGQFFGPTELEEKAIEKLALAIEVWDLEIPKNRNNIAALIEGFSVTASPNFDTKKRPDPDYQHLTKQFSSFIHETHDIKDFSWPAQVDTFAHRNNKSWSEALVNLIELFVNKGFYKHSYPHPQTIYGIHMASGSRVLPIVRKANLKHHNKSEITVNGQTISIGAVLKLGDLIGEDYRRTVHHDVKITDPSWDLYNASKKDYQYVKLFYANRQNDRTEVSIFEAARRLCNGIRSKVRFIAKTKESLFVYTDCFEIDIRSALANGEVVLTNDEMDEMQEQTLRYHFKEPLENYFKGLMTYDEVIHRFYWDRINSEHTPDPLPSVKWQLTFSGWYKVKRDGKSGQIR